MEILLNYWTLAMAAILFLASVLILIIKRNRLSAAFRAVLIAVCLLCAGYLIFILMLTIGFGSHIHPEPTPIRPA